MVVMAWTDTTDCLFCGRAIPIYRKFGKGQFCSAEHEEGFRQQQNQLAVEVLHRTHDALKAYQPVGSSIEDILGPSVRRQPIAEPFRAATVEIEELAVEELAVEDDSLDFDVAAAALLPQWDETDPEAWDDPEVWDDDQALEEEVFAESPVYAQQPPARKEPVSFHFGESLAQLDKPETSAFRLDLASWAKRMLALLWPKAASPRT